MASVIERLEADIREAEEELQQLDEQLAGKPEIGFAEGGVDGYSWEMALARKERVTERIEALREALNRVREGTYGRCDRCGAEIEPERLEILPTTTLCAGCAQEQACV